MCNLLNIVGTSNNWRGKNVVQEEDRFETLARIFSSGKDIVYIDCIRAS